MHVNSLRHNQGERWVNNGCYWALYAPGSWEVLSKTKLPRKKNERQRPLNSYCSFSLPISEHLAKPAESRDPWGRWWQLIIYTPSSIYFTQMHSSYYYLNQLNWGIVIYVRVQTRPCMCVYTCVHAWGCVFVQNLYYLEKTCHR